MLYEKKECKILRKQQNYNAVRENLDVSYTFILFSFLIDICALFKLSPLNGVLKSYYALMPALVWRLLVSFFPLVGLCCPVLFGISSILFKSNCFFDSRFLRLLIFFINQTLFMIHL